MTPFAASGSDAGQQFYTQVAAFCEGDGAPVAVPPLVIGCSRRCALRFEKVPVPVARERMLADGRPPALVEALLAGAETRPGSDLITSTVEAITGVPARTFRAWAQEHADEFR
jgi:hypothetical protein